MKVDSARIRNARERRGWSQEHLVGVAGLSARTVQRLEAEGSASHESRMALAAALGLSADELLLAPVDPAQSIVHASAPNNPLQVSLTAIILAVALVMAGIYNVGKDMALRDARLCKANPTSCGKLK